MNPEILELLQGPLGFLVAIFGFIFMMMVFMMFMAFVIEIIGMFIMLIATFFELIITVILLPFTLIDFLVVFLVTLLAPGRTSRFKRIAVFVGTSILSGALISVLLLYLENPVELSLLIGGLVGVFFGMVNTLTNFINYEHLSQRLKSSFTRRSRNNQ